MFTPRKQRTLAGTAVIEGFGYWSSQDVRLEFRPAPANTGIVFVRQDLDGLPRIPADVSHRVEVPRRTTLQCGEARVDMVEHVMAALAGLQVDNCEVWTDEPEMPGCDGSSLAFVDALNSVGFVAQSADRSALMIDRVIHLGDEKCWVEARPPVGTTQVVKYHLDYGPRFPDSRPESANFRLAGCVLRRAELGSGRSLCFRKKPSGFGHRALGTARRVPTCSYSAQTGRSTTKSAFPTNASATSYSTWSVTWHWPGATCSDISWRTEADTA